jgi:hypothetical protein
MRDANSEYVLHYTHAGQTWGLQFFAVDDEDARLKVESLRNTLTLKGRLLGRGDTLEEAAQEAAANIAADLSSRLAR